MKTFEYSPFDDVYVPYIAEPLVGPDRLRVIWNTLAATPLPFFTRYAIYQALKTRRY